ncbi:Rho guanine nucleotide exchange factor 6 [Heterocephalus glaber]|uniref:Rho guanine nucleotide exchange factor 6 n=1 Tax=Heterocephalus glaber TaxID=10181 RepID=G5CAT9_HETGA|nr:Rho guanine nucleotide exchange factor 6 [Heterocephalus glaber]
MNPEEQIVTWLISLGVLDSPKKTICDPEEFLKSSLKNGVVLCKLINRLIPGSVEKYCLEPQTEANCVSNISEFLKGCVPLQVEVTVSVMGFKGTSIARDRPAIVDVAHTWPMTQKIHSHGA